MAAKWIIIEDKPDRIQDLRDAIDLADTGATISVKWMAAKSYTSDEVAIATRCQSLPEIEEATDIVLLDLKWRESGLKTDFDFETDGKAIREWANAHPSCLVYVYSSGDNAGNKVESADFGNNVIGTHLTDPTAIVRDALAKLVGLRGINCSAVDAFFEQQNNGHDYVDGDVWREVPSHLHDVAALLGESVPSVYALGDFWSQYFGCDTFPPDRSDAEPGEFNPVYEGLKQARIDTPGLSVVSVLLFLWSGMRRRAVGAQQSVSGVDKVFFEIMHKIRNGTLRSKKFTRYDFVAGPFRDFNHVKRVCRSLFRFGYLFAVSKEGSANSFDATVMQDSVELKFGLDPDHIQDQIPIWADRLLATLEGHGAITEAESTTKPAIREIAALGVLMGLNSGSRNNERGFTQYFRWEKASGLFILGFTRLPHQIANLNR